MDQSVAITPDKHVHFMIGDKRNVS